MNGYQLVIFWAAAIGFLARPYVVAAVVRRRVGKGARHRNTGLPRVAPSRSVPRRRASAAASVPAPRPATPMLVPSGAGVLTNPRPLTVRATPGGYVLAELPDAYDALGHPFRSRTESRRRPVDRWTIDPARPAPTSDQWDH